MPTGYRISLGNAVLNSGDSISTSSSNFTTAETLGAGSMTYTSSNRWGSTNTTVSGTYYLGTDGSVYFVPTTAPSGNNLSNFVVTTAPDVGVVMGTTGNDATLNGSSSSDYIYGGNTTTATTGTGNDTISAGAGNDTVYAGDGDDRISGGTGNDIVYGGTGSDSISGDEGNDSLYGDAGSDSIYGGAGNDVIDGGADNDIIEGGQGDDTLSGGTGTDTITGGVGSDSISGGDGGDVIYGDNATVTASTTEHLSWTNNGAWASGTNLSGGFTQDTGGMNVTFSQNNDGSLATTQVDTTQIYTETGDQFSATSNLYISGNGGANVSTSTISFAAESGSGLTNSVSNVSFRISDIDAIYANGWKDQVIVRAYDANGNLVNVTLTSEGSDTSTSGTNATINAADGRDNAIDANGSVLVEIAGPVTRIEIEFNQTSGYNSANLIYVSDIYYSTIPDTGSADTIDGGAGDDSIYGGGGTDSILGGTGNDYIDGGIGSDTIDSGAGDDSVLGGAGTDYIYGGIGNDRIDGGDDADSIYGGDGNDLIYGGAGNDYIEYGEGADTVYGGAGDDIIDDIAGTAYLTGSTVYGGDGNDLVWGTSGNDLIEGGAGNDTLFGELGNDTFSGDGGTDSLYGAEGSDTFLVDSNDNTTYIYGGDEGGDWDTVNFANDTSGQGVTVTFTGNEAGTFAFSGGASSGTFAEIEAIRTTSAADTINASASTVSQTIYAGAGADSVTGGSGADTIELGTGADRVLAGVGNDTIKLGTDTDGDTLVMRNGDGHDLVYDFTSPTAQADGSYTAVDKLDVTTLLDTSGNPVNVHDVTVTDDGSGNAVLTFPDGTALTLVGVSASVMSNLQALHSIGIPLSDGTVTGTSGADLIDSSYAGDPDGDRVDDADNVLLGKGANDDIIDAGAGNDTVLAGIGNDTVYGGAGNDSITGGAGNDVLYGGDGSDTFVLSGSFGNDTIIGGETGESGFGDVIDAHTATSNLTVNLTAPETGTITDGTNTATFSQIEGIATGTGNDTVIGSAGADLFSTGAGADRIDAGAGNDIYEIGGTLTGAPDGQADTVVFSDGDGSDLVYGFSAPVANGDGTYSGLDKLDVSDLHDANGNAINVHDVTIASNGGHAQLVFPNGETITLYGITPEQLSTPEALNAIGIPLSDGTVSGTAGSDIIDASYNGDPDGDHIDANDDVLPGMSGNDDLIEAGAGNDTVLAGSGNDILYGGTGNDVLDGGTGNDTSYGEAGDDRFVISSGTDTVIGGETSEASGDTLDGSAQTADVTVTMTGAEAGSFASTNGTTTFSQIEQIVTGSGNDTVTGAGGNDSIWTGAGNDVISGGDGNDLVYGGTGNDTLSGDAGNDRLDGGDGDDVISGGTGTDTLYGGDGDDSLTVAEGDTAYGGSGDDTLTLADLAESTTGTLWVDGGNGDETTGDTLKLGKLADWKTLTKTDDGTGSYSGTITLDDGSVLTFSEIENIICFTPGTRIATAQGARPIETLKAGDMVITRDHGLRPIRWIGSRTVPAVGRFAPVRIRPGVVTGLERDLLVSPQHRMLFQGYRAELLFGDNEVLIAARHLIDGKAVTQDEGDTVTYIHMLFDEHEIVFAEGAATESFHPGRMGLTGITDQARDEVFTLFPELRSMPETFGDTARRCLKRHEALLLRD